MTISQSLLPEFDNETAGTRKTIERMPDGQFGWKPHEKSFTLGQLANHIVNMHWWMYVALTQDSFDWMPGGTPVASPEAGTRAALLANFDKMVADSRKALEATTDEQFQQPWSLLANGQAIFTMPRAACLRAMCLNHIVHHRGQLTVYYRMLNVPVPGLYGPSADEASPA